ncbi:unnamed protein product [Clonostachys rhizophaga]|uniref:Uncharacterized protein n=1 Tax=Clonostachys rhizophaga TaxID=160324 RepID=A0A9N9VT81_9HYPO|nr:unnamed protein product [Clonostachys rhizophaga]
MPLPADEATLSCRAWFLSISLTKLITDPNGCSFGEGASQMPLPLQDASAEPVARYRNITSSSLTDQLNGLVMVLGNEHVQIGCPAGTWIYEGCVKAEGSLTTQVNGLVVGVEGGCQTTIPHFPGMNGVWSECDTVEKLPNGMVKTEAEIQFARELDLRANHTVQINGGLLSKITDNRIFVPQVGPPPPSS